MQNGRADSLFFVAGCSYFGLHGVIIGVRFRDALENTVVGQRVGYFKDLVYLRRPMLLI